MLTLLKMDLRLHLLGSSCYKTQPWIYLIFKMAENVFLLGGGKKLNDDNTTSNDDDDVDSNNVVDAFAVLLIACGLF